RAAFGALEEAVRARKIRWYGTATWNGYRVPPQERGHLSLAEVLEAARAAGGDDHHFRVVQLPYNLAMLEAFTLANQRADAGLVPMLRAAEHAGVYTMASASMMQSQLARGLPPELGAVLPGLATDAQRALQFVRSTPGVGTALVGMKASAHGEETGLTVVPRRLVGVYSDPELQVVRYPDGNVWHYVTVCFECVVRGGSLTTCDETLALEWVPLDALPAALLPNHRIRIRDARARR